MTREQKARDAKRALDTKNILTSLTDYYIDHNLMPRPSSYGETGDMWGYDYSYNGGFLTFLRTGNYMSTVPVDPKNNSEYSYVYYCYSGGGPSDPKGLYLGYWKEYPSRTHVNLTQNGTNWADGNFTCQ
jgi:hypothetical protein